MRILVINPNSTAAMTTHVAKQLKTHLDPQVHILQRTATNGPPVIATRQAFDEAAQTAIAVLQNTRREGELFDRVLLACFGDPGLEAMGLTTKQPVVGLARASMEVAEHMSKPYSVVTAGTAWEVILVQRFKQWGASNLFRGVQVMGGTGLDVFNDPLAALPVVQDAITTARLAGAENIILGGAVFAGYKSLIQESGVDTHGLLDCVECAAKALLR